MNIDHRSRTAAPMTSESADAELARVVEAYFADLEKGRAPPVEEVVARHSHLGERLKACLSNLQLIEQVTVPGGGEGPREAGKPPLGELGDFRILREIGRGGMGIVYEADQISLGRKVALKVLPFAAVLDQKQIQRFKNEAHAAAHLHHPNIVPIFSVGCERGVHYYAMQFIDGQSLAMVIRELRQFEGRDGQEPAGEISEMARNLASGAMAPPPPTTPARGQEDSSAARRSKIAATATPLGVTTPGSTRAFAYFRTVASLGIQAAEALQHSHDLGIFHRDIKPGNLLLDARGNLWITDFGLAQCHGDSNLTLSGDILGTLRYMSPEQALAKRVLVDHRTDVYSLGVTLYEFLTLEPAYPGTDRQEVIRRIVFEEPRPPRRLNRSIPADLETIVLKAMEKDPASRYATAAELAADLGRFQRGEPIRARLPSIVTRLWRHARRRPLPAALAAALVLAAAAAGMLALEYEAGKARLRAEQEAGLRSKRAREEMLPEVAALVEKEKFFAAFKLASEAEQCIPGDPELKRLWERLSARTTIITDPPGARISFKDYWDLTGEWNDLGTGPLEKIRIPLGTYRWRLEMEGYETRECGPGWGADPDSGNIHFYLWKEGSGPPGMALFNPNFERVGALRGFQNLPAADVPAFWIDQREVTNREFQKFVDRGGYQDPKHWEAKFVKYGRALSFEEAMGEFRDRTGQPGPSTWENGKFESGKEDHPVAGVSWFEAAAYARFRGKCLPTIFHWSKAACLNEAQAIFSLSNFGTKGTAPAGSHGGIGWTGLYDMAGNVKEWCQTSPDATIGKRYILGGGWDEPEYMFRERDARSPWDHSPSNGFRCAFYPGGEASLPEALLAPVPKPRWKDYRALTPVPEAEFEFYRQHLYAYDPAPLNAAIEEVDDSPESWRRERVTYEAPWENERLPTYLFLPKGARPPYQAIVYFPGGQALGKRTFEGLEQGMFTEFVVRGGRALMYPVLKGTYERQVKAIKKPSGPIAERDKIINWSREVGRSIDYLESREDIDKGKIGYYGLSWGASQGPIYVAVESRLRLAIFAMGGLVNDDFPPASDPFNFLPRIKVPALLIGGEHDVAFPVEESQKPFFELLGAPSEKKKHALFPGGHGLFGLFSRQTHEKFLGFLDQHFGPAAR